MHQTSIKSQGYTNFAKKAVWAAHFVFLQLTPLAHFKCGGRHLGTTVSRTHFPRMCHSSEPNQQASVRKRESDVEIYFGLDCGKCGH